MKFQSANPTTKDTQSIPVYGKHPRQLNIYDRASGEWLPKNDPAIIVKTPYLAVSYRQTDFPDKRYLQDVVQSVCESCKLEAYWLDFACTGESQEEKNQDLYRIADVFRYATLTLIVIKGQDDTQLSEGWLSWGSRKWTLPEALLSKNFVCKIGKRLLVTMDLRSVANHAYSDDEDENILIALYDTHGKDFLANFERVELLCKAIRSRTSGPGSSVNKIEGEFTAYPAEWVYALMGFFLHRIQPTPEKTEKEAFMELLDVNGLECEESGWEKFRRSSGKKKIGIRVMGSRASVRITDEDLPNHVLAAKFNYGQTVRTTCEKGTREETLAKIYRWLGLDPDEPRHDDEDNKNILWLHGLAGSGKSTIAQTVAERCHDEEILGATFFLSRDILECKNILNIIPTLSYELSQKDDVFKSEIATIFSKDKGLQHAQVHIQLNDLIVKPLRKVEKLRSYVVVIDALDECEDDKSISIILDALDKHISKLAPLKFLITSRPDDRIYAAFRTLGLRGDTKKYNLNDVQKDEADNDIQKFLASRLQRIGHNIPQPWPSSDALHQLVEKAQGLFIFASTAVKFLEGRNSIDLNSQLQLLLRISAPTSNTPYAHLDQLYLQVLKSAFPIQDKSTRNILQTIFALLILGKELFSVKKLQDLMSLPQGTIRDTLRNLRSLLAIPDNDDEDIRLIHPSIHDFLIDAKRSIDPRFVVDEAVGHSFIASCCLTRLKKFTTDDMQMQSCTTNSLLENWRTVEINLLNGNDAALTYAYRYWIFHIDKSDGQLDESVLWLLGELVSKQRALDVIIKHDNEAISMFLELFNKLSCRRSSPSDIMKKIYEAVIFLCRSRWTEYIKDIKKHFDSIKDARSTLKAHFSYKDGLYDLDRSFPLLPIAISNLSNFLSLSYIPEENDIRELRNSANGVHEFIMQQIVPEDQSVCSALRDRMSTLYEELRSNSERFWGAPSKRGLILHPEESLAADQRALQITLTVWIKSLKHFQTEVHKILGLPEIIESSEVPNAAVIDEPERIGTGTSATLPELSNEVNNDRVHTSVSDDAGWTTSGSPSRPSRPVLNVSNETTSKGAEAEAGSHDGTTPHAAPFDSRDSYQDNTLANQSANASSNALFSSSNPVRPPAAEVPGPNDGNSTAEQARSSRKDQKNWSNGKAEEGVDHVGGIGKSCVCF